MVTTRSGRHGTTDVGGVPPRSGGRRRFTVAISVAADARQIAAARQAVRLVLSGHRRLDDVMLVVSELATNACLHGSSGADARVRVRASRLPFGFVYVSVADCGRDASSGSAVRRPGDAEDSGLGLVVVDRLVWRRWQGRRRGGGRRVRVVFARRGPR